MFWAVHVSIRRGPHVNFNFSHGVFSKLFGWVHATFHMRQYIGTKALARKARRWSVALETEPSILALSHSAPDQEQPRGTGFCAPPRISEWFPSSLRTVFPTLSSPDFFLAEQY